MYVYCKHCEEPIRPIRFALGVDWAHENAGSFNSTRSCRPVTLAEPPDGYEPQTKMEQEAMASLAERR